MNSSMQPQGPPGPIETLGLAIVHGKWYMFQRSIKKKKRLVFHQKSYLFNYAYKSMLILTVQKQHGAARGPQTPCPYSEAVQKPREMASFQKCIKTKHQKHDHVNMRLCMLKPMKYLQVAATSEPWRPDWRLGAAGGALTPPPCSEALQKPREITSFQETCKNTK